MRRIEGGALDGVRGAVEQKIDPRKGAALASKLPRRARPSRNARRRRACGRPRRRRACARAKLPRDRTLRGPRSSSKDREDRRSADTRRRGGARRARPSLRLRGAPAPVPRRAALLCDIEPCKEGRHDDLWRRDREGSYDPYFDVGDFDERARREARPVRRRALGRDQVGGNDRKSGFGEPCFEELPADLLAAALADGPEVELVVTERHGVHPEDTIGCEDAGAFGQVRLERALEHVARVEHDHAATVALPRSAHVVHVAGEHRKGRDATMEIVQRENANGHIRPRYGRTRGRRRDFGLALRRGCGPRLAAASCQHPEPECEPARAQHANPSSPSALVEQAAQARWWNAILGLAVLALDLQHFTGAQEVLEVAAAEGGEGFHHAELVTPAVEADLALFEPGEGHAVEQLIEQPGRGEVFTHEVSVDAFPVAQALGHDHEWASSDFREELHEVAARSDDALLVHEGPHGDHADDLLRGLHVGHERARDPTLGRDGGDALIDAALRQRAHHLDDRAVGQRELLLLRDLNQVRGSCPRVRIGHEAARAVGPLQDPLNAIVRGHGLAVEDRAREEIAEMSVPSTRRRAAPPPRLARCGWSEP